MTYSYSDIIDQVEDEDSLINRIDNTEADRIQEMEQEARVQTTLGSFEQPEQPKEQFQPENVDDKGEQTLREDEIIGPTLEPGEYEPSGYMPGGIQDPMVNSPLKPIADFAEPVMAGLHDWFADEVNSKATGAWGMEDAPIKKWKKQNSEVADAARDLTALIAPLIMYTKGAKGAGSRIHASGIAPKRVQALGNDPAFKALAGFGIDVGVGVYVDSTASQQEEEHNLSGNLKKWFPDQTKWIPNWFATADNDSPDTKRHKNLQEGAGVNMGVELIGAGARFVRAAADAWQATRWIPKNEQASSFFGNLANRYQDSALRNTFENLARSAEQRNQNLDDIGDFFLQKVEGSTIDQPIKGVHDVWDLTETGMRSVDEADVASAMTDVARIAGNNGTQFGRLANFIQPAALKKSVAEGTEWLLDQVTERVIQTGKFDVVLGDGTKLTDKTIKTATTDLAEYLMDPAAESGFLVKMLKKFDNGTAEAVRAGAVNEAIQGYMKKIYNLDRARAEALLETSTSGAIADMSDSLLRNIDSDAAENLQEEIWDRVETLLAFKGMSNWAQQETFYNPNLMERVMNRFKDTPTALAEYMTKEQAARETARNQIVTKARQFVQTLKQVNAEKPQFLKPLYEMYDATNGNVNTMYALNKQFQEEFTNVGKLLFDKNPDMPNRFVQAGWANIMNSTLSAFGTPIAAAIGNATGMLGKPATQMLGAALNRDWYTMRKTWNAYNAVNNTFTNALKYGHETMMKLTTEPKKFAEMMRPDLAMVKDNRLEAMISYAEAALTEGNDGPMMLVQQLKQWEDLAQHPVMRFNGNSMSGMDSFTKAFQAQIQAKFDAFDYVNGRLSMDDIVRGDLSNKELYEEAYNRSYEKMFNKDGILIDPRVKYASEEISLQLDTGAATALGQLTRHSPIMRTIFMFPRSQGNMLNQFLKFNPANALIGQFVGDLQAFTMKKIDNYSGPEIMEALRNRGMTDIAPDQALQKFIELRNEAKGRWAFGTIATMGAWNAFVNDNITGDNITYGGRDLDRQDRQLGKPVRSYRIPGTDKYMSYAWMGPIADWLATTVNVMDNFDRLTEAQMEEVGNKLAFVAAAALKDKNAMMNFQPVLDILNGNEGALNRYLAGTANNALPMAGQRGEWGKLFSEESREIDRTVIGYARNRNKFADVFVPEDAQLPVSTDWIYGKPIGENPSFLTRVFNTYNKGMMISDEMGPEARFISLVGFNSMPSFQTSPDGIPYTNTERAELFQMVGQDGLFLKTIQSVMKRAEKYGSIEALADAKSDPYNIGARVPKDKYMGIHDELRYGLNIAVNAAHARLTTKDRIETEVYINELNESRAATGAAPLNSRAENFLRNLPGTQ